MSFRGAMDLCFLVLLLSLISTITRSEIHTKNGSEMKITQDQAGYGADDFDCVDIYKQPAFSHPLLKNHKIQMKPSFSKNLGRNEVNPFNMADIGLKGEGCPLGKVPIQRKKANTSFHQFSSTHPGQHFATLQYSGSKDIYRGARAKISMYNPRVIDPQISAAYIWVQRGGSSDLNNIQAGWAVHPRLYGDTYTRLTTYWTRDNYQRTGCYNAHCPGFVQINSHFYVGMTVGLTSIYGGIQYEMDVMIKQDKEDYGNWWLMLNDHVLVGYWPKVIFSHLQGGATYLRYGGWVFISPQGSSPPMGSGHLPNHDYNKSCSFNNIKFLSSTYQEVSILDNKASTYVDSKCYDIIYWHDQGYYGNAFTFGGPGGQCGI